MGLPDFGFAKNLFCWFTIGFGILFNAILIRLVVRYTPEQMRIYSKILLQTCVTDILLLIMTLLFLPHDFITVKGELESIVYGLVIIKGVQNRIWNLLALVCWIFLLYVSMFGYVSQFIFRYLVIVRGKNISSQKYFLLLFLMLLFPFAFCVLVFICFFPPVEHSILEEKYVVEFLGINLDDRIVLAGYSFNDIRSVLGFFYMIIISTFAYLIIFGLAFRIKSHLVMKSKSVSFSEIVKRMIEMNKQVSLNLIIQASMPLIIYFSVLFLLLIPICNVDVKEWKFLQYYILLSSIPMFLPSAINPIVSICTIKYYRYELVSGLKRSSEKFVKLFFRQNIYPQNLNENAHKEDQEAKWAINVANN